MFHATMAVALNGVIVIMATVLLKRESALVIAMKTHLVQMVVAVILTPTNVRIVLATIVPIMTAKNW